MAAGIPDEEDSVVLNESDMIAVTCAVCGKQTLRSSTWLRSNGTFICPFCGSEGELFHPEEN